MKVLVVDDERDVEPLFRQRFRREIKSGELELVFAFSGEEALTVLNSGRTDVVLVLSDINMPGMDGIELLKNIKAVPPPIPVCMMTAYGSDDYRRRAEQAGCDGYLTKPVDFDELKARISSLPPSR
ncbi:MAG TPA: response regulator [Rhodothermales bacterium]|nr:response regulator [Rhodothermales bacterium]